uniref:Uncharacterized protein n=2 Tax=viral metagenome TaxID=1070528 RepID=A0A6M3IXJ7_9ZZZZ
MQRVNALEDGLFFPIEDSRVTIAGSDLWDGVTAVDYRYKGAVWDSEGNFYLVGLKSTTTTGILKKFDSNHSLLWTKEITTSGNGGSLTSPGTILIDDLDNIIIVWNYANTVQIYDTDGILVSAFSTVSYNNGIAPFDRCNSKAELGPDGNVYMVFFHYGTPYHHFWVGGWSLAGAQQVSFELGVWSSGYPASSWYQISIGGSGELILRKTIQLSVSLKSTYWDRWTIVGAHIETITIEENAFSSSSAGMLAPLYRDGKYISVARPSYYYFGVFGLTGTAESCFGQGSYDYTNTSSTALASSLQLDDQNRVCVVTLPFVDAYESPIMIQSFNDDQTDFQGYTKNEAGTLDGASFGTPDGGVAVPANNALIDYDFVRKYIFDLHDAIDRLARYFVCADNSVGFYRWVRFYYELDGLHFETDGLWPDVAVTTFVPDNLDEILYYLALKDVLGNYGIVTEAPEDYYCWVPYFGATASPAYDFDPGEVHECLTFLESATLLGAV